MSTDFVPDKPILILEIYKFDHHGVSVDKVDEDGSATLTDGKNHLWVYDRPEMCTLERRGNELVETDSYEYNGVMFTRYGQNDPTKIIEAIEEYFDVCLVSEYEDQSSYPDGF